MRTAGAPGRGFNQCYRAIAKAMARRTGPRRDSHFHPFTPC
ncbi:hypothetical protein [Lysobacter gummosus]